MEENKNLGNDLLDLIIAKTYARHSKLTEEEFKKELGFENCEKSENELLILSFYNLLIAMSKALITTNEKLNETTALLKLSIKGE